jgi:hypothetical protein
VKSSTIGKHSRLVPKGDDPARTPPDRFRKGAPSYGVVCHKRNECKGLPHLQPTRALTPYGGTTRQAQTDDCHMWVRERLSVGSAGRGSAATGFST